MLGLGRLGEFCGDACVGAAALGMVTLKIERIRGGALCMSCLEIMELAVWLLHLQLMEPAMEGSWATLADGVSPVFCADAPDTWSKYSGKIVNAIRRISGKFRWGKASSKARML